MLPLLALDYGPDLLNEVANQYIRAANSGFGLIGRDVARLLNVLIVLSVAWSAVLWAASDEQVVAAFARKVVYIGLFVWLVQNWQALTDKLATSFMTLGLRAGGFDDADYYVRQPGNIAYLGYTTIQPLMDQVSRLSGPVATFKNLPEIAFLLLAMVAIVTAFCVITVQVVMAVLTFKFGSLAAFVLVPFAVLSKTAFIAERPLGYVVAAGVRLMVMTLVLGIGNGVFQQLKMPPGSTVTTYQAFCVALAAVLLAVLAFSASRLATDLVTGGPSLGVGTAINAAAGAYRSAAGGLTARPTVLAVKAAAAVGTGGTAMAASAATTVAGAAARGIRGVARAGTAGTSAARATTATSTPAPPAGQASKNTGGTKP